VLEEEELGITVLISQFRRADTEDVTFFSGMQILATVTGQRFHRLNNRPKVMLLHFFRLPK
jgi:hypothetical protein